MLDTITPETVAPLATQPAALTLEASDLHGQQVLPITWSMLADAPAGKRWAVSGSASAWADSVQAEVTYRSDSLVCVVVTRIYQEDDRPTEREVSVHHFSL